MENALNIRKMLIKRAVFIGYSLLGSILITLCSFIKIPFYPISFTMQTFAIFFLALTQSPKQAFGSAICYLICGSMGLPVFAGVANSFWLVGKSGGYLVAFPIAAYLVSKISEKSSTILALLCGQVLIYGFGFLWLSSFFGASTAFTHGVLFFIPSDLLKCLVAMVLAGSYKNWRVKCARSHEG